MMKRSDITFQNNDIKSEWVYIDTQLGNIKNLKAGTYKGWVVDYYLSDRSEFKQMDPFKDCVMEGCVGDFPLSYRFRKDGTYTRLGYLANPNTPDGSKGKIFNCEGKLYRYRDVVIAQDEKSEFKDAWLIINTFYFREDGKLCSIHGDGNGNQLCTKDQ